MSYSPTQYARAMSPAKDILLKSNGLDAIVHKTLATCAEAVGATLGPGGMSLLLQRGEIDTAPISTKDGVTVFRHLGFKNPAAQVIMESARDSAVRTAQEAGDGTTTATILAYAIVDHTQGYCTTHPRVSPQRVLRLLEKTFRTEIEPTIKAMAAPVSIGTDEGRARLVDVAKVSANGDEDLARSVLECFDVVGDEGNVTILELEGPSRYEVEQIEGYSLATGYEHSTKRFYQSFINDVATQMCVLQKPLYILYYGQIPDLFSFRQRIFPAIVASFKPGPNGEERVGVGKNIVLIATGFGERALAELAVTFKMNDALNVYPVRIPLSVMQTGQYDTLLDLAAVTGAKILDAADNPPEEADLSCLGRSESFEAGRFRTSVLGFLDPILIQERERDLKAQISNPDTAQLDRLFVQERLGKLTSGLAKLKIYGSSSAELREKRDRAEDAVMSVRGALKHGILPGGGYTLASLFDKYAGSKDTILSEVLAPALRAPVERLFENSGYTVEETTSAIARMMNTKQVFDLLESQWEPAETTNVIDSVPAVVEAIRNSLSIASLGTCGGVVTFYRDRELDYAEARAESDWQRNANDNPADERP